MRELKTYLPWSGMAVHTLHNNPGVTLPSFMLLNSAYILTAKFIFAVWAKYWTKFGESNMYLKQHVQNENLDLVCSLVW